MNFFKPEDGDIHFMINIDEANAKLERDCVVVYGLPQSNGPKLWVQRPAAIDGVHTHKTLMLPPEPIKQESCAEVLEGWANACNGSGIIAWEHWQGRAKAALARVPK